MWNTLYPNVNSKISFPSSPVDMYNNKNDLILRHALFKNKIKHKGLMAECDQNDSLSWLMPQAFQKRSLILWGLAPSKDQMGFQYKMRDFSRAFNI